MKRNISANYSTGDNLNPDEIFSFVFRNSTEPPGYYVVDLGKNISAGLFRKIMIDLKSDLSEICQQRLNRKLNFQSMGRFNHQKSSALHRDSADSHSFLMLGYEPTTVGSSVFVADYSRYISDTGISLTDYFDGQHDTNVAQKREELAPYIQRVDPFPKHHYRILILNNNKSFDEPSFGVFHGADVNEKQKDDRYIDYMMTYLCKPDTEEYYDEATLEKFIETGEML